MEGTENDVVRIRRRFPTNKGLLSKCVTKDVQALLKGLETRIPCCLDLFERALQPLLTGFPEMFAIFPPDMVEDVLHDHRKELDDQDAGRPTVDEEGFAPCRVASEKSGVFRVGVLEVAGDVPGIGNRFPRCR